MAIKSTREKILHNLLSHPRSTIDDLASAVEINPISVRHHLSSLQADNLVTASEERHGVGRPRLVYSLTEKGVEQFPTRYLKLTDRLLELLKKTLPEPVFLRLFTQMAEDISKEYISKVKFMTLEEKLDFLKEYLAKEGFTIELNKEEDNYTITITSCPYYHLIQKHPEICSIDQNLISNLLSAQVTKSKCVLDEDAVCAFRVSQPVHELSK